MLRMDCEGNYRSHITMEDELQRDTKVCTSRFPTTVEDGLEGHCRCYLLGLPSYVDALHTHTPSLCMTHLMYPGNPDQQCSVVLEPLQTLKRHFTQKFTLYYHMSSHYHNAQSYVYTDSDGGITLPLGLSLDYNLSVMYVFTKDLCTIICFCPNREFMWPTNSCYHRS